MCVGGEGAGFLFCGAVLNVYSSSATILLRKLGFNYVSPWKGRETYCVPLRPSVPLSVRPSVCPSVRHKIVSAFACITPLPLFVGLSVTKSCPLYNLITVKDISTKVLTFVKLIQTMCHA